MPEGMKVLYVSTDQGVSWRRSADLPRRVRKIYVGARSPRSDRTLYVVGTNSVTLRRAVRTAAMVSNSSWGRMGLER